MLRWIGGCALVALIIVCLVVFLGYRKLQNIADEGPAAMVTIEAPAARVFASIADADSMAEWRSEGLGIRAARRGPLQVGDSLVVQSTAGSAGSSGSNRPMRSTWYVTALVPDRLVALEMRDSSGATLASRRDSLIAQGDSTQVVSIFAAPGLDSVRARRVDSGAGESRMVGFASKMFIAAARMQSQTELRRLKERIEGRAAPSSAPQ